MILNLVPFRRRSKVSKGNLYENGAEIGWILFIQRGQVFKGEVENLSRFSSSNRKVSFQQVIIIPARAHWKVVLK